MDGRPLRGIDFSQLLARQRPSIERIRVTQGATLDVREGRTTSNFNVATGFSTREDLRKQANDRAGGDRIVQHMIRDDLARLGAGEDSTVQLGEIQQQVPHPWTVVDAVSRSGPLGQSVHHATSKLTS
jgi:hypothetical protein